MYDFCDVLRASHSSADVISHVLFDYGEGSMGNGLRKLAGEILVAASREGYENGFSDGYSNGHSSGVIRGSIITACAAGALAAGAWCITKMKRIKKNRAVDKKLSEQKKIFKELMEARGMKVCPICENIYRTSEYSVCPCCHDESKIAHIVCDDKSVLD